MVSREASLPFAIIMPQGKSRLSAAVLNLPTLWLLRKSECAGAILLRLLAQRETEHKAKGDCWVSLNLTEILFVGSKRTS